MLLSHTIQIYRCIGWRKNGKLKRIYSLQNKRKGPDLERNQDLFGGDYWTRTSDLLRKDLLELKRAGRTSDPVLPALLSPAPLAACSVSPSVPASSARQRGQGAGRITALDRVADMLFLPARQSCPAPASSQPIKDSSCRARASMPLHAG